LRPVDTRTRPAPLLIRRAQVEGLDGATDVRLSDGCVADVAPTLTRLPGEEMVDARGGQLLPGLHDHHVHLRALAAADGSVHVGPPEVHTEAQLAAALRSEDGRRPRGQWIRAVGYHQSVAGDIDRRRIDSMVADRPVRVQHRSGVLWILNTAALRAIDSDRDLPPGVELDSGHHPTGRIWREDEWLRERLPARTLDLASVSAAGAANGTTGFTDATPHGSDAAVRDLAQAGAEGAIVQRLHLMSAPGVDPSDLTGATLGPVKFLLDDDRLPPLADFAAQIVDSHRTGRPVAVHCVTRVQASLALAALEEAGPLAGDRMEHGAVIGSELFPAIRRLGLTVVTQPAFVHSRGDRYLEDVHEDDQPDLWRLGSLLEAGAATAAGTDAPFGPADPWLAVRAARDRLTASGRVLGRDEAVSCGAALRLFAGAAESPEVPRTVRPGQPADLCLLAEPLAATNGIPVVVATIVAGRVVHRLA